MNAFSTVGDVSTGPEFAAPGNAHLLGIGGFRLYTWRVHKHGYCTFDNDNLGFAPRDLTAHFPVSLHLRVTNFTGPSSVMRSTQAEHHRMERAASKNDR